MVDKVKNSKTVKLIDEVGEFVVYAAIIAAAIKLFTQAAVVTRFGELPVWQAVAAILVATVIWMVRKNRSK